jgi:hypothetical protein
MRPGEHTVRVCVAVIVLSFPHKLVQNDRLGGTLDTCQDDRNRISPDEVPRCYCSPIQPLSSRVHVRDGSQATVNLEANRLHSPLLCSFASTLFLCGPCVGLRKKPKATRDRQADPVDTVT